MEVKIVDFTGVFAENKDIARDVRINQIIPALENGEEIILDFTDVEGATQSFIHALISEVIRTYGADVLDKFYFKNCTETIKKIISIVVEYMQES